MKNKKKIVGIVLLFVLVVSFVPGCVGQIVTKIYVKDNYSDWNYKYQGLNWRGNGGYNAYFEDEKGDEIVLTLNSTILPITVTSDSMQNRGTDDLKIIGFDNGMDMKESGFLGVPIVCVSENDKYTKIRVTAQEGELFTIEEGSLITYGNEYKGSLGEKVYWRGATIEDKVPITVYGVTEEDGSYSGDVVIQLSIENAKDESGVRLFGCDVYSGALEKEMIVRGR